MKVHFFSIDEAVAHGVNKAIILSNLRYWLDKNVANGKNDFDGYYWTYNSSRAFAELFPYFTQKSISRWINELEADGIVLSSNKYNTRKSDRTKWYTILKEYQSISQSEESISQSEETLPDRNPDSKPDTKDIRKEFATFWEAYPKKVMKLEAEKAFKKAIKIVSLEVILKGLKTSEQIQRDEKKFIPNAQKWLNGGGWDDEAQSTESKSTFKRMK